MVMSSNLHARTIGTRWLSHVKVPLLAAAAGLMLMMMASPSTVKAEAGPLQPKAHVPSGSQSSPYSAARLAAITGSATMSSKSPGSLESPESPAAEGEQDIAQMAYNSTDDEYLVVWEDKRNELTTDKDIYGQRVSATGTLLGGPFPISTAADFQNQAAVAYNSTANEYLVVWQDVRAGIGNTDLYGQRVSGAGALAGGEIPISTATGHQFLSDVEYNSTGNEYLVVWEDDRVASDRNLYGQRVLGAGALLGGEIPISTAAGYQADPEVAYNSASNEYLVVWEDNRTGGDIYGQRVSGAGALLGGEIPISTAGAGQYIPEVAYNSTANEYLVVWQDDRTDDADLYGQRVSGAGALLGGEIPISTAAEPQSRPRVAYNSTGNEYLVVWEDDRVPGSFQTDIYAQRVSGAGALLGGEVPISTAVDFQYFASVAYSSTSNGYLVVWSDYRYSHCGNQGEIFGQRVSGAGALQGSNFNITPDPPCTLKFADVPPSGEGSTFYTFIHFLTCKGIVNGYPCGGAGEACNAENDPYYRPGANVTRGQLSKIIANSAGLDDEIPVGQQQFADVPPGSPFYEFVERLAETGAISGYPCGGAGEACDAQNRPYFRPNNPATRGQISKIVATAAGFDEEVPAGQQTFTDVPPDSPFWVYIERLAAREVISGYSDASRCPTGTPCFRYNDNTTRGQMAKIAANAFYPGCQIP